MALMDVGNKFVWQAIKLYLPMGTKLSSVYRPAQAQLDFIVKKAQAEGYKFARPAVLNNRSSWSEALDFVRSKGYKVAEPGKSLHQQGLAYDFTGPYIQKIKAAILKAVGDGKIRLLNKSNNLIIEPINNCVHVEIEQAWLDFEPYEYV